MFLPVLFVCVLLSLVHAAGQKDASAGLVLVDSVDTIIAIVDAPSLQTATVFTGDMISAGWASETGNRFEDEEVSLKVRGVERGMSLKYFFGPTASFDYIEPAVGDLRAGRYYSLLQMAPYELDLHGRGYSYISHDFQFADMHSAQHSRVRSLYGEKIMREHVLHWFVDTEVVSIKKKRGQCPLGDARARVEQSHLLPWAQDARERNWGFEFIQPHTGVRVLSEIKTESVKLRLPSKSSYQPEMFHDLVWRFEDVMRFVVHSGMSISDLIPHASASSLTCSSVTINGVRYHLRTLVSRIFHFSLAEDMDLLGGVVFEPVGSSLMLPPTPFFCRHPRFVLTTVSECGFSGFKLPSLERSKSVPVNRHAVLSTTVTIVIPAMPGAKSEAKTRAALDVLSRLYSQ